MSIIWKYPVPLGEQVTLYIPAGGVIRSVQHQGRLVTDHSPQMWVEVSDDPMVVKTKRVFKWLGTGHAFEGNNYTYIATLQFEEYVFHLYERK